MHSSRAFRPLALIAALVGLALLLLWPPLAAAMPQSDTVQLQQALQLAYEVG